MIIRKKYTFNNGHIVRNCSSERCKFSIHAHTYSVEFFFTSNGLDNGSMVIDFGLLKNNIKKLINCFNNTFLIWNRDKYLLEYKDYFDRYIIVPFSPSAEELSRFFLFMGDKILNNTNFNNGEKCPRLIRVRVDETKSGYALADLTDRISYTKDQFESNIEMFMDLFETKFINEKPLQQV